MSTWKRLAKWKLTIICPICGETSFIEPGEMIRCKHCFAAPKILWNGKSHFLERSKRVKQTFKRHCAVCGKEITITLYEDGTYEGGHFFGKIPRGGELVEYWECNDCYRKDSWDVW